LAANNPEALSVLVQLTRNGRKEWWKLTTDLRLLRSLREMGLIVTKNGVEYELFDQGLVRSVLEKLGYIKYRPGPEEPHLPHIGGGPEPDRWVRRRQEDHSYGS
jgi:uncharacterized protein YjhX (UPF0386 family)